MGTVALVKKCRHASEAGSDASGRRTVPGRSRRLAGAAFVAAAACASTPAQPSSSPFAPDASVREAALALVRQAAAALAPEGARVVATAGAMNARLRLAPCARVEPHLVAGLPTWGATRATCRKR